MKDSVCPKCGEDLPPVLDAFCPNCREMLTPKDDAVTIRPPRVNDLDRSIDRRCREEIDSVKRMIQAGTRRAIIRERLRHRGFSDFECIQIIRAAKTASGGSDTKFENILMVVAFLIVVFGVGTRIPIIWGIGIVVGMILFSAALVLKLSKIGSN